MRLAVAGKGGAGKTTISATLARLAARSGRSVVALDADANPNLSAALGMSPEEAAGLAPVPTSLVSRRLGGGGLAEPIDEVLDRYALTAPDGVRLLGMGAPTHADEGCLCSAHAVVSSLLEDLGSAERFVVVDMEASPEHLSRGTVRHVDAICLVAEPYYRSLETVRRMAALVAELSVPCVAVVANKVRSSRDEEAIRDFCGRHAFALAGVVPWSDEVVAADRAQVPVVEWSAAHDAVTAVAELAAALGRIRPSNSTAGRA
ncbi:MAG: AAA family ATPase [Nocardioidaceae bacterium]|nr:AAA family ATPase [Nocardioidaceae bacterium]MBA3798705.1 AAA family ATPase [Geodermatophilaceae bacterium]